MLLRELLDTLDNLVVCLGVPGERSAVGLLTF